QAVVWPRAGEPGAGVGGRRSRPSGLVWVMPARGAHVHTPVRPRPRTGGFAGPAPDGLRDVVVVGGGIVGLAVAWCAARAGLTVTVLDPAPGDGATHAAAGMLAPVTERSEEHTSELQSRENLVCRLLLEK